GIVASWLLSAVAIRPRLSLTAVPSPTAARIQATSKAGNASRSLRSKARPTTLAKQLPALVGFNKKGGVAGASMRTGASQIVIDGLHSRVAVALRAAGTSGSVRASKLNRGSRFISSGEMN